MVNVRLSSAGLSRDGVYMVATNAGDLRALVDTDLAARIPDIQKIVAQVCAALDRTLPQGVAVCMRFEQGPGALAAAPALQEAR